MSLTTVRAVTLDYDHVHPLVTGDVRAEGIDLVVERPGNVRDAVDDPDIHVVELSWSRHLRRLSEGDRSWVGIPILPRRAFCHRAWFVRNDSTATDFTDLRNGRIGITEYPATGNTWAREAAREAGLDVNAVDWVVGSFDGGPSGSDVDLPARVTAVPEGTLLVDLLVAGELDAVVCQLPPRGFHDGTVPVRRLLPDYAAAEKAYYGRTGYYPAHHILGVRAEFFAAHPTVPAIVYDAFEAARLRWQSVRLKHGDTSPWVMADIEEAMRLIGPDWQPNGSVANRGLTERLCGMLAEDGLLAGPVDPDECFAEFDAVYGSHR